MPAKKAKPRTAPTTGKAQANAKEADASSTHQATTTTDAPPTTTTSPAGPGVFGIVVTALAGLALAAGIGILSLAIYTYENVNTSGTFTVDQQIEMATGGVIAGTGLAIAGLVTLGIAYVGFRRA